jgi:hypothetical protein
MLTEEILLGRNEKENLCSWYQVVANTWLIELIAFDNFYLETIESKETCPISVQRVWMDGRTRSVQRRGPDCQEMRAEAAHIRRYGGIQ